MNKLVVLDGDFKSELRRHFLMASTFGEDFPLKALKVDRWSVLKTHLAFLRAGAQIIRTNTYYASSGAVAAHLDLRLNDYSTLIERAVILAKQAVTKYGEETGQDMSSEEYQLRRPLIAGSCGSAMVSISDVVFNKRSISAKFANERTQSYLEFFHDQRARELVAAGVDMLAFESISTFREVLSIFKVLKKYETVRAWITLYCPQDTKLMDGTEFSGVAAYCYNTLHKQEIMAIGVECDFPETIMPTIRNLNDSYKDKIPCVLYADKNYILPVTENTAGSSTMLQHNHVQEWWNVGIRYIGGGIHTVAEDIQQIRKQVDNFCKFKNEIFPFQRSYPYRKEKSLSVL
ncbi:PREDICTED: homocysteine S-methyltransferase-like [Dinoponera quadriceps]|uniref:Homocysteine S-methyltransferase-like n=1 Tax=Dinoponera quadriceps TaxID=609295 RepID=A0A6P3WY55_DINQU|nr:PREDICTED: homocysteine S-methyltransferase-like [Dinoponera quadriceps]